MKADKYVRQVAESFQFDVSDGWGNENSMILQGLGMMHNYEKLGKVLDNLIKQTPYDKKYAGIASFYVMEKGETEVRDRIKMLMRGLASGFDEESDEMALVFYTKYETKLGGKEHYQDVMNRYRAASMKEDINHAYFMTAVIEGIESIDQAIYEYYDGLKRLFKTSLRETIMEDELDITDKALTAFSILKACRLKVILAEKYEKAGLDLYEQVLADIQSKELNKGAAIMMMAERLLH
ncbi:MAG: hypothetical protein NC086_02755 [Alistipes sp.]|nr:hypothetical protein [Alistipes sp.]